MDRKTRRSIRSLSTIPPEVRTKPVDRPRVGLVLAGGGARGAYEAGVLQYLCEEMPRETGIVPWFDVVCGTSVGALNACFVASTSDLLARSIALLVARWTELRVDELLNVRPTELLRFAWEFFGGTAAEGGPPSGPLHERRGGLIDTRALERFVLESVPWSRIRGNLDRGQLRALALSATHVASGKTTVFVDTRGELPPWSRDPWVRAEATHITPWHALASAAIPLLFPPMPIGGRYYVDGGLRQNTPLSPAVRLGVDRVLVVSLRYQSKQARPSIVATGEHEPRPSPFFIIGKTLNALMIDRIDYDLDRLRRMNAIADAGTHLHGQAFLEGINGRVTGVHALRRIHDVLVRPSEDVGEIAARYARSDAFVDNAGLTGRAFRRLADGERNDDSDLLSYLLFDGGYGAELIDLGRRDARARHDELAALFTV